jgi:SAM-dependent methyltransferase
MTDALVLVLVLGVVGIALAVVGALSRCLMICACECSAILLSLGMRGDCQSRTKPMTVPMTFERFKWPKVLPELTPQQRAIADDFYEFWLTVYPQGYNAVKQFSDRYPLRHLPDRRHWRTLDIGAGLGGHIPFEQMDRQDYHCLELRDTLVAELRRNYPSITAVLGDCQQHIPYADAYFDRVLAIHTLEHLPNLPKAINEIYRVLKPNGIFSVVIPCDPGLIYEIARKVSAERIFKKRYRMSYRWFVEREHLNSPDEVRHEISRQFKIFDTRYFPLPFIPIADLNLCVGLTARKTSAP